MGVGGRQILGGCKRSVNFLPEFPKRISAQLGGLQPHAPRLLRLWLKVSNLILFDRLVMTCKIMNKLIPESLWDKFELRSVHSKYNTSNCYDLQIPRLNTERATNGFKYSALKSWNGTPVDIREASTLNSFEKKLKANLFADQK